MTRVPRPRLIRNWRAVLRYGWSVKFIILAGILTGAEAVMPLLPEIVPVPVQWLAVAQFLTVMAALVARLTVQRKISGDE